MEGRGTGPEGRVIFEDVTTFLSSSSSSQVQGQSSPLPPTTQVMTSHVSSPSPLPFPLTLGENGGDDEMFVNVD